MLYLGYKFKIDTNGFEVGDNIHETLDLSDLPFEEGDIFVLEKTKDEHIYLRRIWTGSSVGQNAGLSRRRSRVRVPSSPPTILQVQ